VDGDKLMYKQLMINGAVLTGLISGLFMQPVFPEPYTGGVSTGISGVDLRVDNYTAGVLRQELEPTAMTVRIPQLDRPVTTVHLRPQLSAVGFHWEGPYHIITYVDPASSVYGTIFPGDREISLAGMDPKQSEIQRKNYGANNTTVEMVFQKPNGQRLTLSVIRQPVANFDPAFARTLLPY
jgi:hypothetical protein